MKIENRKSVRVKLKDYRKLAKERVFFEVTEWINGEIFDIAVSSFSLTWGEYKALKKVIKFINKPEDE